MAEKEKIQEAADYDNLDLWNKVRTPDPKYTKTFVRAGGFKGTSISPMALIMMATERWGPMGIAWHAEEVDSKLECGVWFSKVRLYPPNYKDGRFVEQWGGTQFHIIKKDGTVSYDDEAAKKSYTDAISKCLSWMGFGADVHMGLFDDVKYVNDAAARFDSEKAKMTAKQAKERAMEIGAMIEHAEDQDELKRIWQASYGEIKGLGQVHYDYVEKIKDETKAKLGGEL